MSTTITRCQSRACCAWPLWMGLRCRWGTAGRPGCSHPVPWLPGGSGRPAADQPDGRGDEQHCQREQPAALDPLEWPEPAARLIARPLRVSVLGEVLQHVEVCGPLLCLTVQYGIHLVECGIDDLVHRGLAECRPA